MKKAWALCLFVLVMLVLTACSSEETRTFELSESGIDSTLIYTYSGDEVISQEAENIVNYEELGITKEEAEEFIGAAAEEYEGLAGVDYSIEFGDEEAVEQLTVNYDELDYEEAQNVTGIELEGDPEEGISMERSAEMLESQGYTEVGGDSEE